MKKLTILFFIMSFSCFAQKYGNIWYFGDHAGIDFNSCNPIALTNGQIPSSEGCSTICDTAGNLLFYTNSDIVWNKLHSPMPNGNLVSSGGTLSQVIIIPKPLSQNIFYIITTEIQGQSSFKSEYHIIDVNLNGGLGDVSSKNNLLDTAIITEQVAATFHSNGTDVWLIVHEYGNNRFLSYLLNATGINFPVISNVGPSIIPCTSGMNARGEIKFSPNSSKIALNNNGIGNDPNSDYLWLFDFDNSTGVVSNPISLPYERGGWGLSFSPDNSKLYAATWKAFNFSSSDSNKIFQFDISSNDSLSIANSKTTLYSVPLTNGSPFGDIKIGPNGKLYIVRSGSNYLAVINLPNQPGILCDYNDTGFYLGGKMATIGLNNYIEYQTYCMGAAVNEIHINNLLLGNAYPNPTASTTRIDYTLPRGINEGEIVFYNLQGKEEKCFKVDRTFDSLLISTHDLPAGIYLYQLQTAGGGSEVKKIVIIK